MASPEGLRERARSVAASSVQIDGVGWARLGAVALAPIVAELLGLTLVFAVYLVVAAWVAATTASRHRRFTCLADTLLAVGLVVLEGGLVSPYAIFILTIVVSVGVRMGPTHGVIAGSAIALAQISMIIISGDLADTTPDALLPMLAVAPLTGLTGALGARVVESTQSGRAVLERANRLLVDLQRISHEIPGGLDVATVAHATLSEVRTLAPDGHVIIYVGRGAVLDPIASTPSRSPAPPIHVPVLNGILGTRGFRLVTGASAAPVLGPDPASDAPYWSFTPLRQRDATIGVIAVSHADVGSARTTQGVLVDLAVDAGIAVDNALLFDGTRARAVDRARRQIAHDLHDSVAQSLAHIRMELELLTLQIADDEELSGETDRLSRVAGRALEDVRSTIAGLRSRVAEDGLPDALRAHVADLQGLGAPRLSFEVAGEAEVPHHVQEQVLRLAQEAISNAVRHADASEVTVSLELSGTVLELVVEDDGCGLEGSADTEPGHGVGLRAMRERTLAIGGELTIRDRLGGGTVVALVCPVPRETSAPPTGPRRVTAGRERR